ncbi:hypothetical protein [uncultured Psychroserpens sp.]|uniref:hypothetical protein n=1 Tax=uncultured Psychroserpens sp. TaxID=255436 RepID=UPI0026068E4E|nr:hypothetical protein [uncultured Psychroserpens sp.]
MKQLGLILLTLLLNHNLTFSQTKSEIDSLLNAITKTETSKDIIKTVQAKRIINFGEKSLLTLSGFFTDSTRTQVKSECHNRNITKGEIAIILADRIEVMPYYTVTQIQNCLLTYCSNNPNKIEYYLGINNYLNNNEFKERYISWLFSKDRLKRVRGKKRKKRKRILSEWKNSSR